MTISEAVPTSNRIVHRVLTDGEYIVNHSLITGEDGPTAVRFDLWRLANGAVAEHWADEEQWASETASGHTQIDGQPGIDHSEDTEATRRIATSAVQTILVEGDTCALDQHLAGEAYIQHNPRFADDVSGLVATFTALPEQGITMQYDGIRQVVADGNFAYTRSEGVFGGQPFVFTTCSGSPTGGASSPGT
jgi:predicted SnoaL-like aldol condensation-catalyzing enzyme